MKLSKLVNIDNSALANLEITGVTCDSRRVEPGFAYVCIVGSTADGHNYAASALENGAAVVIAERDLGLERQIVVDDTHRAYSLMSARWFGNPADSLKLIGVTGTNGKTSITYILKKILEDAGHKVGVIGTIQNMIGEEIIETNNTTPDAYELHRLFALMRDSGCDFAVMECSSHALDQKRVSDVTFEIGIFTNLTQDHLDYHITMDNYLEAKKLLFKMCKTAVINYDDKYYNELISDINCKIVTYSAKSNDSTYSAKGMKYRADGLDYELVGYGLIQKIKYGSGGQFSVYNSMAAIIAAMELGINIEDIAQSLNGFCGVKGRAEVVPTGKDYTLILDYAHTPDGLKNILDAFSNCEKNRLVVLFGCGGDRDKTKRPIMGSIAADNADFVIVTSDNPRSEDPSAIIKDIIPGVEKYNTPFVVIEDRKQAIEFALKNAQKDDIIVLAGKGHETYQVLSTGKIHFDEREVVADILKDL